MALRGGGMMMFGQRSGPRRMLREARERYLDYIEDLRGRLRATAAAQQADADSQRNRPGRFHQLNQPRPPIHR